MGSLTFWDGGGRRGAFSAGAADEFQKLGVPVSDTMIATSAGILPLLSRALGVSHNNLKVYKELIDRGTLTPSRLLSNVILPLMIPALRERLLTTLRRDPDRQMANVPLAIQIMEDNGLDARKLRDTPTECFARVVNLDSGRAEYVNLRDPGADPRHAIEETAAFVPYYMPVGRPLTRVDGMMDGRRGMEDIAAMTDDHKLFVLNEIEPTGETRFQKMIRPVTDRIWHILAGDPRIRRLFESAPSLRVKEQEWMQTNASRSDVDIIRPPRNFPLTFATNSYPLIVKGYSMGQRAAAEWVERQEPLST